MAYEINLEHVRNCQKHLPFHPEWWKKFNTDEELKIALLEKVKEWEGIIRRYETYSENTLHEISLMRDCNRYNRIVTHQESIV